MILCIGYRAEPNEIFNATAEEVAQFKVFPFKQHRENKLLRGMGTFQAAKKYL